MLLKFFTIIISITFSVPSTILVKKFYIFFNPYKIPLSYLCKTPTKKPSIFRQLNQRFRTCCYKYKYISLLYYCTNSRPNKIYFQNDVLTGVPLLSIKSYHRRRSNFISPKITPLKKPLN